MILFKNTNVFSFYCLSNDRTRSCLPCLKKSGFNFEKKRSIFIIKKSKCPLESGANFLWMLAFPKQMPLNMLRYSIATG